MTPAMMPSDSEIGNLPPNRSLSHTILRPTNTRTVARPYFSRWNSSTAPASRKYIERRPRIAITFEVKTMSGSRVMAKMAGTESTAKTMSLNSRKTSATNRGVACHTPESLTKNLCPSSNGVTGTRRRTRRISGFFSGARGLSGANIILMPVTMRNTPNSTTTMWYCMSRAPIAMKIARKTSAPMMP